MLRDKRLQTRDGLRAAPPAPAALSRGGSREFVFWSFLRVLAGSVRAGAAGVPGVGMAGRAAPAARVIKEGQYKHDRPDGQRKNNTNMIKSQQLVKI